MAQDDYPVEAEVQLAPLDIVGVITNETVGVAAAQLVATPFRRRRSISFQNIGGTTIFIAHTSAVTTSGATQGWNIAPGGSRDMDAGENVTFFAISDAGGGDLQVWEM